MDGNQTTTYTFGVVPQFEQRKLFRIWRPILDRLETRTGFHFRLKGSPRIPVFEQLFLAGQFDFAYMNPYHALMASAAQGYIPMVRDGSRQLKGILVVNRDSDIKSLEHLNGQMIAFPAPNALGASLLMRADLKKLHHINFMPLYVQTHSSVYLHVATGLTKAGGGVASTLARQKQEVREHLRVIYETRPMPPHPIVAHPRIPVEVREKVRQALLDIAASPEGAKLMAKIPMRKAVTTSIDDYKELGTWGLDAFYVPQ